MTDWVMTQAAATIILGIATIALAVISAYVLYSSFTQNKETLEQNKIQIEDNKNLIKFIDSSLKINNEIMMHNRNILERMELNNRPCFKGSEPFAISNPYNPSETTVRADNIGGKDAFVSHVHFVRYDGFYAFARTYNINKIYRSGTTLEVKADLNEIFKMRFDVTRKDGQPLGENEIDGVLVQISVHYRLPEDAENKEISGFSDILEASTGNLFARSNDYYYFPNSVKGNED